jgi:hypothetical protein
LTGSASPSFVRYIGIDYSAVREGSLHGFTQPALTPRELTLAQAEGWILGCDPRVASSKLPPSPS